MRKSLALFFMSFFWAGMALALMPPMELAELEAESNTIVLGEITDITSTGELIENPCVTKTGYKATLKVLKVIKGKADDKLTIRFKKFDFKEGCVGSPDHRHFVGENGKFYLSCQEDHICRLTHWNGVIKNASD